MRQLLCSIAVVCAWFPSTSEGRSFSFEPPLQLQYQDLALEPSAEISLSHGLSVGTALLYESGGPSTIGLQEITVRHQGDRFSLWGGKARPAFGRAWDHEAMPMESYSAGYELDGKLGLGGSLLVAEGSSATFRVMGTMFESSDQASYLVSAEVQALSGLSLLGAAMKTPQREGQLVGLRVEVPIGSVVLEPLIEFAQMSDHQVVSTGLGFAVDRMVCALGHSTQFHSGGAESIVQASLRWAIAGE